MLRCKDCKERHIGCHSSCTDYLTFRKELDEKNARIRLAKFYDYIGWHTNFPKKSK